jgi:hypothetical protein
VKLDEYDGKTIKVPTKFLRKCEFTFRIADDTYTTDRSGVLYAAQYLADETAKAFDRLEVMNWCDNTT